METRGIESPLETGQLVGAVWTMDVAYLLDTHLSRDYFAAKFGPASADLKLIAVGFSMGGLVLSNYFSKVAREQTRVHCAVSCCSPWDLIDSGEALKTPAGRTLYAPAIASSLSNTITRIAPLLIGRARAEGNTRYEAGLRRIITHKEDGGASNEDAQWVPIPKNGLSVYEFDQEIISAAHGFPDRDTYYKAGSSFEHMHKIEIPMLCVAAVDDPIVGPSPSLERWGLLCKATPHIAFMLAPTGGHLGFIRGPLEEPCGTPGWVDERVVDALDVAITHPTKVPVRRDVPDAVEGVMDIPLHNAMRLKFNTRE